MKTNFTNSYFNKTLNGLMAFCVVLLMSINAFAQVTATEDFENESTANSTTPHTFSESGISFSTDLTFQKFVTTFGYNNSTSYIQVNGNTVTKTITIQNASTSFKINSFAAYVATATNGNGATNGAITFVGTLVGGSTVTATVNVASTGVVPGGQTREANMMVDGLNFAGTPLDGVYMTSLSVSTSATVQYAQLDHIGFTTQAVVTNQFSIDDVSQSESNSGTSNFTFTVTRSNNTAASSVQVQSSNGTATSGTDYTAFPLTTVNFTAGSALTQTVNVVVNGDVTVEPNETFTMTLSNPSGGVLLDATGTGTIVDDDAINEPFDDETHQTSTFTQSGNAFQTTGKLLVKNAGNFGQGGTSGYASSTEPFAVGNQGSLQITSPGKSFNVISIDLWSAAVSGSSPNWTFTPTNGTITFTGTKADGSGTITHTAAITPSGTNVHSTVLFAGSPFDGVQLSAISFSTPTGIQYLQIDNFKYGTATLTNTQLSIDDVSVIEGTGGGSTTATFTVTRTNNTTSFTVNVASSDGTATAGTDYTAFPSTALTFTSGGALTQTVNVTVLKDATIEPIERFNMTLSGATNGTVYLKQTGIGTILNDDSVIETFEDETNLATTFAESGVSFSATGGYRVRQASTFGSGSSNFYLTSTNNAVGNQGTFSLTTANKVFKLNGLDAWVGTTETSHSSGSVTFTGTLFGGGTVSTTKTITATSASGAGYQLNVTFTGTPLENVLLTALQVSTAGTLTECDIDNFNYTVVNTLPIIEVVDASDIAITNGGVAGTANNTDFGGVCVTGGTVSKTYTIKNTGNTNLTLSGSPLAVLGGADAGQFSITTQPTSPITAAGSVIFTVQFDPSSAGVKNATITLTNNDATNSPYVINIKGTGNANPIPSPSSNSPLCSGTTLNLTSAASTNYSWTGPSSFTSSLQNPSITNVTTGATGVYTITQTSSANCTASATVSVTVNALPTATPSSNTPVCAGNTLNLTSTVATNYLWTGPNSFSGTVQNPSISNATIVAGGTYTLRVTNASGCTSTATTSVTVNTQPSVPTSPSVTPSIVCTSAMVTLSATGCAGTLSWFDASDNSPVSSTPTVSTNKSFYAKCTVGSCTSGSTSNVNVTVSTPLASSPGNVGINWTGLISTDWNTACNWNPAWVPDATNSAVVIDLKTNQPTISGTVPSVKLIYVNSGATLTVNNGGTLNASSTTAVLTLQGGNLINDGTINLSGGGSSTGLAIGATASITNRGTITTNNLYGASLQFGNLTFTNESTGIFNGDFKANNNTLTLTNRGTINYAGGTYALSLGSSGSSVINTGTISVTAGSGISNPSGSTITNNACGKILMTGGAGLYENGGTTTNAGLIQMLNTYDFTNNGTFTNNGVVKAKTVSSITNNKVVITNACPIFTLGGTNNYTVSGIFTDAAATISAGTYNEATNKFTANNTIPTGTQTLYAQVTNVPAEGMCTFVVPFDFINVKATSVSVNSITVCPNGSVTLSATCASGTLNWYTVSTGGTSIGTGTNLSQSPTVTTTYYASCETTSCASGRVATNAVTISSLPTATPSSNTPVCTGTTLNLSSTLATSYLWSGPNSFTSSSQNPAITNVTAASGGTYTLRVTNLTGCTASATTAVTVNTTPTATASSNSPACVGANLSLTGGGVGTYLWTGPNSYSSTAQSPTISNVTVAASGVYTFQVMGVCTAMATTSVTVSPAPTVSVTPSTQTICSGEAITKITLTGTGTSYTWTRDNTTSATGIAASGSEDITGSLTNTTNAPLTVTFTITPVGMCAGVPVMATVIINPIPTASASIPSQSICSGTTISGITLSNLTGGTNTNSENDNPNVVPDLPKDNGIMLSATVVGTVFNWTRDNTATVTGIAASGTGNITGNLVNNTASPIIVTFTITPSYTNAGTICTGTPITATVTVNPNPTATITDAGTAFCSGSSTTLSAPADPNYTYAWQRSLTGIANPNSFTAFGGTTQTQEITTAGVYRAIVTNQFNCSSRDTTAVKFGNFVFSNSLVEGDAQQTGRMNRFATVSTCASPTSYPGDFTTTGARFYDSYTVTNPTAAPVCATIGLTSGCGTSIFSAAYLGSFNPTSVSSNYLADHGSSFPATGFYEVNIPANGTIVVVVHEVNSGTGCSNYNLRIDVPGATVVPTASSNSPICAGNTLNLTGTGTGTYAWSGPNSFTSTEQSPSIANVTTLATGTYTISVTNTNGCVFNATTAVTVNATPTATASSNSPICAENTLNLSASGGVSYAWTGVNSFNSTQQNPSIASVTSSANGTYQVVVTNIAGCTAAATTSVMVNTLPTATASSNSPVCAGTTINLLGGGLSVPSLAPTGSYAWSGPNSFSSTLQNPSITSATNLATGTYQLIITNENGCTAMTTTSVMVNALPVATASSNSPVCVGNTVNLLGGGLSIPTLVPTGSYAWTGPDSFSSTLQNPSIITVTTAATGIYQLIITNDNGCTAMATTSVTINTLPMATATNTSPICTGTTLNLSAEGGVSFAWTGVNSFSSTMQNPSILLATTSATGTYQVVVTNAAGCTAMATTSATVNPTPVTPTGQASTQIIFGGSVTLTATGCSGVSDVLKWYQSVGNLLVTMPVSPTTTSNYYAKCETTLNGITCISSQSADVTVTVLSPNPPVATGGTTCISTPLTLTATGCSGSTGTFELKWYQNSDNTLVTMPVSPSVTTEYYAKCEQTFNAITATSEKSNVVTLTVLNPAIPVATGATIYSGNSATLTATGCTGEGFVIKWYQTTDNVLVTMPVSPTVTTQYYAKCEQTANGVTCISNKSNDVLVTVVNRIFVDITKVSAPIQNGNSWATAYGNLQTGLSAATAGVEVWVAKGTYKTTETLDKTIYFNIPNDVIVYGGFAGTEDALIERNFRTNVSILSGDIGTQNVITDNSYHVVLFNGSSSNTVLNGFTITGGNANFNPNRGVNLPITNAASTSTTESGGGIVLGNAAMPMIVNCTINSNSSMFGGGLFAGDGSKPTIMFCKFMGNQSTFGAAIYLQDGSHATISSTLISGNRGVGGLYNNNSNPIITNTTFSGNGGYNGGIFNSNSQPVVKNSIIWGNSTPFNDTQSIISYSIIQGGYAGTGNLNYDPQFVNQSPEGLSPNLNGDYHLSSGSLGIDRGDNGSISLTDLDLDGNLRRYNGGRVDMGAYEFQGNGTSNVVISIASGNWEINSTWDANRVPQIGDIVIIDQNHTVTLNGEGSAKNIEYRGTGTLKFNSTSSKLNIGF
ncbi:Calx-beta domain-containing protein [Arcicella sp. LKC2W]|uniref:Ig-like domain-containing protein n=1 Tax=Arcicella sp. LKC2W TaxID=2984198 RepID=UPI002B20A7A6|nr:Calx-beta domain-containing protein [Arcicella sp. LKC2W]MEA5461202.1 Calx-beta domain-containing protein [Arcicella sp. LKC2W]